MQSGKRFVIEYTLFMIDPIIIAAKWRLDNAKSPAAMLQEKTARTPHIYASLRGWLPAVRGTLRSLTCRTYVHTRGRVILLLFRHYVMLSVCTVVRHTAFSSLAWKHNAQHDTGAAPQKQ